MAVSSKVGLWCPYPTSTQDHNTMTLSKRRSLSKTVLESNLFSLIMLLQGRFLRIDQKFEVEIQVLSVASQNRVLKLSIGPITFVNISWRDRWNHRSMEPECWKALFSWFHMNFPGFSIRGKKNWWLRCPPPNYHATTGFFFLMGMNGANGLFSSALLANNADKSNMVSF